MKRLVYLFCIPVLLLNLSFSCEKVTQAEGEVEFYLLESYETVGESCAIDPASAVTAAEPLIAYGGIVSYHAGTHAFTLTDEAKDSVKSREYPVTGTAFAVTAGRKVVYTGYFWPAHSSASCQWTVIDPYFPPDSNKLEVKLGYPGTIEGVDIPDERNSARILDILRRDGKLVE